MTRVPSIGDIYLARHEDSLYLYTLIGTTPEDGDGLPVFASMVLLGGKHFALSHETDYCNLRKSDRSPMFDYVRKYFGQSVKLTKEAYDIFFPVNRFGINPIQRWDTFIQSKEHLEGILEAHFQPYALRQWNIALDYYESLNRFQRLYTPRLSL